jgi:hypothetical protein
LGVMMEILMVSLARTSGYKGSKKNKQCTFKKSSEMSFNKVKVIVYMLFVVEIYYRA